MEEPLRAEGDARAAVFVLQHGSIDGMHTQASDSMAAYATHAALSLAPHSGASGVKPQEQADIGPIPPSHDAAVPESNAQPTPLSHSTSGPQSDAPLDDVERQCEWCGSPSSKYKNLESFLGHRRYCRRLREPNYVPVKYEFKSSARVSETGEVFCESCGLSANMYKNANSFQVHRRYCRKKKRKAEELRGPEPHRISAGGGDEHPSSRPRIAPAPEQRPQRPSDPVVERFVSAPLTPSQLAAAQLAPQPPAIAQEVFSPFALNPRASSSSSPLPVAAGSQPMAPASPPTASSAQRQPQPPAPPPQLKPEPPAPAPMDMQHLAPDAEPSHSLSRPDPPISLVPGPFAHFPHPVDSPPERFSLPTRRETPARAGLSRHRWFCLNPANRKRHGSRRQPRESAEYLRPEPNGFDEEDRDDESGPEPAA
eukprot:tig00000317_g24017.t1